MARFSVADIVFVRSPFSDLSQQKLRPALVLADVGKDDLILCQITSKPYTDKQAIQLDQNGFASGYLARTSYIRPAKLFTANMSIIEKKAARVKPQIRQAVVRQIIKLFDDEG